MTKVKKLFTTGLLITGLLIMASWGFLVHKTAHQLAVYELPKTIQEFFYKNMDYLVNNAPRPDIRRNSDPTEATKHFIDLEAYGDSAAWKMPLYWNDAVAKYSKDTLLKYGYVPYHVIYMKNKLVEAFKSGNKDSILFYAADIGHYIEDANVPLHTTTNYDGQFTNQKGIHALWESVVPEIEISNYNLYSPHQATYLKQPELAIWNAVRKAYLLLPNVLEKEKEVSKNFTDSTKYKVQTQRGRQVKYYTTAFGKAYAAALKNSINEQLLNSANLVADFWYTAWIDSGKPDLSILSGWSEDDNHKLKSELESFKKNNLIKDQLLLSKREEKKSEE